MHVNLYFILGYWCLMALSTFFFYCRNDIFQKIHVSLLSSHCIHCLSFSSRNFLSKDNISPTQNKSNLTDPFVLDEMKQNLNKTVEPSSKKVFFDPIHFPTWPLYLTVVKQMMYWFLWWAITGTCSQRLYIIWLSNLQKRGVNLGGHEE